MRLSLVSLALTVLLLLAAVPAPASLPVFALGLAAVGHALRRKRA